jgi:hypothetical protein
MASVQGSTMTPLLAMFFSDAARTGFALEASTIGASRNWFGG